MPTSQPATRDHADMTTDEKQQLAEAVLQHMLAADAYSRWLGVEVLEVAPGRSTIAMTVRPEMVNGFGISHGGIVYSLADSAFAFAVNSFGRVTVAVDCTMSYPAAVRPGDVLTARAVEQNSTRNLAFCEVTVTNQRDEAVGYFRGTAYRTPKLHFPVESSADGASEDSRG